MNDCAQFELGPSVPERREGQSSRAVEKVRLRARKQMMMLSR